MADRPSISPLIVLGIGILAVSNGSIFVRKALVYTPPITVAAYRLILAAVFLFPFIVIFRKKEIIQLEWKERGLAFLSGVFLAFHFASWVSSLQYTTVASSVILVSTTPLWVALINPFTLKEKIGTPIIVGGILTLFGGIVVGLSDQCTWHHLTISCPSLPTFFAGKAILGDGLALFGSVMAAGYLLVGRSLRQHLSLASYAFLVYSMGALVLLIWATIRGESFFGYPAPAYGWFLALAIVPQLIGHTSFNWALRYLPTAFVSLTFLGEPIGTAILAYFILKEVPSGFKLMGIGLILVGLFIASYDYNSNKT